MAHVNEDWAQYPCKLWTGATIKGYGVRRVRVGFGKFRNMLVHRLAWMETCGAIPPGLFILHHCDVRNCYEVRHLFPGTNKDNMQDASQKGRVRTPNMGLTECKRGHPFTPENTYVDHRNRRGCRICRTAAAKQYRQRKKEKNIG